VLARRRLGGDVRALLILAAASCLFTAFLEAGFLWTRRGFDAVATLRENFNLAVLDIGYPAPWQVLAFGLGVALACAGRQAFGVKAAGGPARRVA
jgi:hypothetical protein